METLVDVGNLTASATSAQSCWGDIGFEEGFRIMLYALIFVSAVLGNTLVIVTLVQKRRMRTVTNVFLLNLAVSDLLLGVFCIPVTLVGSVLRNFVLGAAMCKIIPYIQGELIAVCRFRADHSDSPLKFIPDLQNPGRRMLRTVGLVGVSPF